MRAIYNLAASYYYAGDVTAALANMDAGVARATATGLTFSAYGLEIRVLQVIARYVTGDWDGSLEAAELAGDAAPDTALARLAAAALYVEVGRGLPTAIERGRPAARCLEPGTSAWRWSPAAARPTCCAGGATWTGRRTRRTVPSST